jgi:transcriptional regulator with XRE-family HTH domain
MSTKEHVMTEQAVPQIPDWTVGWRIQRALDFAGVKVEDLAEELGVSRSTISRWMHDGGPVRAIYLKTIALRTGVPYEWLRDGEHPITGEYPCDNPASKVA